ncbi:Mitochondrial distribution and morphology protein 12 [Psilocybe cubensis]|uniref:Mitochondrial distribution and morphology protein 12 n=2 Tax=Psilocybe cubensis TaxID=181762 RepID=A0ACB8H946_PSICU|nr:Mitochondrial distribution and morphology protein 12 [Psilocybe cubensis]KAH9484448.1 Mitochondrial distribution and morphology protein 12 [Psilocybe cubensis]
MSIDLEWVKLDATLASYLVDVLNRQLKNAERPSFIGPVEVTSLEFGTTAPDVELVDLRDIYRDFLEDEEDNDSDRGPVKVTEGADDEEGFEWVSRRAVGREESLAYQHLPPHIRYGRGPTDLYSSIPALRSPISTPSADMWNSTPNLSDFRHRPQPLWQSTPMYPNPNPVTPFPAGPMRRSSSHEYEHVGTEAQSNIPLSSSDSLSDPFPPNLEEQPEKQEPPPNPYPNLQLHLHVNWHSNLRITLTTSLLINYPSPMFMSLPIKLSITGIVFNGELAVAYEGQRKRIHICILDDLDPYGPAGDRPKRDSTISTPPELDDDSPPPSTPSRPSKPLPIGQRLLPSIYIESEIGQADKHVLKNVTRVERFIQDVIRKTVEEELVFPNFHTLVMGDP